MKKAALAVFGIFGLAVVALVVVPYLIDLNNYKREIAAEVMALTGRALRIDGAIDLAILPTPTITVRELRLANVPGGVAPDMLRVKAAQVRVSLWPLLSREIRIKRLVLLEPKLELERLADGRLNWDLAIDTAVRDGVTVSLDKIVVQGAQIAYRDGADTLVERFDDINLIAFAEAPGGPYRLEGKLVARGLPVDVAATFGGFARSPIPVTVDLATSAGGAKLAFTGSLGLVTAYSDLRGRLKVEVDTLAPVIAALAPELAAHPDAPLFLNRRFTLGGTLEASASDAALNDIAFELGGVRGGGAVNLGFGDVPRIDVALDFNRIDVDRFLADAPADGGGAATGIASLAALALPADLEATLDLRINGLVYNGSVVRQAQFVAALEDAALVVQQASALLPGGSDFTLFGVLETVDGAPRFDGQVEASADNLRAALDWLGYPTDAVPADRLRKLSFSAKLAVTPKLAQFSAIDLRIDLSRISGGVNFGLGRRPSFNAAVMIDRINLDAYMPVPGAASSADGAAGPLEPLMPYAGELKAHIGKLVYGSLPMSGLEIDAGMRGGTLTLRSLTVADLAGVSGVISGVLEDAGRSFDLTYNAETRDAAPLLRALDVMPAAVPRALGTVILRGRVEGSATALTLDTSVGLEGGEVSFAGTVSGIGDAPVVDARVGVTGDSLAALAKRFGFDLAPGGAGPVTLDALVKGGLDALEITLEVAAYGATGHAEGTIGGLAEAPAYDLAVTLAHPSLMGLIAAIDGTDASADAAPHAVQLAARVTGDSVGARATEFDATIGPNRFTGAVTARWDGPRPYLDATLTAGEVAVGPLFGASSDTPPADDDKHWSRRPIALAGLDLVDGRASLAAQAMVLGPLRIDGAKAQMTLTDGVLEVEELTGRLYGGPAHIQAAIANAEPPSVDVTFALDDADLASLARDLAGTDALSGRVDIAGAFLAKGRDAFELVSRLAGEATLSGQGGAFAGIDLGRLDAGLGGVDSPAAFAALARAVMAGGATAIESLDGRFTADRGVIRTDDLRAVLDGAVVDAEASVDLPRWRLELTASAALASHADAPPMELSLSGPIDDPKAAWRSDALEAYIAEKLISAAPLPAPAEEPEAADAPAEEPVVIDAPVEEVPAETIEEAAETAETPEAPLDPRAVEAMEAAATDEAADETAPAVLEVAAPAPPPDKPALAEPLPEPAPEPAPEEDPAPSLDSFLQGIISTTEN